MYTVSISFFEARLHALRLNQLIRDFDMPNKKSKRHFSKASRHQENLNDVLAMAEMIFGSRAAAEVWINMPALGLDGRIPAELIATTEGLKVVKNFLGCLLFGVYW